MSESTNGNTLNELVSNVSHCKTLLFSEYPDESVIQRLNIDHATALIADNHPYRVYQKEEGDGQTYVKWYSFGKFSVLVRKDMHQEMTNNWITTVESAVLAPTTVALEVCRHLQDNGYLFFKS